MLKKTLLLIALVSMLFSALPAHADGPEPITLGLGTLTSIAISPGGTRLAVGTTIGVYFYDAQTFAPQGFWKTSLSVVNISWSPHGNLIALVLAQGRYSRRVEVWSTDNGTSVWSAEAGSNYDAFPVQVAFNPDGSLLAVPNDASLRIYDASTGGLSYKLESELKSWRVHYRAVAFSPDGQRLAACCEVGNLNIWDTSNWQIEGTRTVNTSSLAWSPDSRWLAFVSEWDGGAPLAPLWDLKGSTITGAIELGEDDGVASLAFAPMGQTLAVGTRTGGIQLWQAPEGRPQLFRAWQGHHVNTNFIVWSPTGNTLYTAGANTVRAWEASTTKLLRQIDGFNDAIYQVTWSADGRQIIAAKGKQLVAWDIASRQPVQAAHLSRSTQYSRWEWRYNARGILADPTGKVIAVADRFGVSLHNARSLQLDHRIYVGREVRALAFSPDGTLLATGGDGPYINLWDTNTGRGKRDLIAPSGNFAVIALAFNPDGKMLYALEAHGLLRVWDLSVGTSSTIQTPDPGKQYCYHYQRPDATISLIAQRAIVAPCWGDIIVSDIITGNQLYSVNEPYAQFSVLNPNGTRLAAVLRNSIKIWDLTNGTQTTEYSGHTDEITDIAISPDGSQLAASSLDGTILIWNVP